MGFTPLSMPNKGQRFYNDPSCQKERRHHWRTNKLKNDPDYRAIQQDAQARRRENDPDHYRSYREAHPDHTAKNRQLQHERKRRQGRSRAGQDNLLMIS